MKYAYIDGDDIGLKIESSFMNNDENSLKQINYDVCQMIKGITDYLIMNDFEIIFSGADGIICKKMSFDVTNILTFIRENTKYLKFSIGVGNSLRDSYMALRYAKSHGKNIAVIFDNHFKLID